MAQLLEETKRLIPDWVVRKRAQYERIADALPKGVNCASYGPGGSTFMISYDDGEGFYEGALISQLPRAEVRPKVAKPQGPKDFMLVPEHKKRIENRMIDLSDEEIDQVLGRWRRSQTALTLDFVVAVWDGDASRHETLS